MYKNNGVPPLINSVAFERPEVFEMALTYQANVIAMATSETGMPEDEDDRIENATVDPYPDGTRVRVMIVLTPFFEKPNLTLQITGPKGNTISESEVLELITRKTELTMHLRSKPDHGTHTLSVALYYDDNEPQDVQLLSFATYQDS